MFQSSRIVSWVLVLGLAVILSGCSSQAPQEKQKTKPAEKSTQEKPVVQGEHTGHEHAEAAPANPSEGLADLSASDRAAAEKQRVCPVSGDVLGAEGKPYKVIVKGQTVFLCCAACEKQLLKNPDKYLAKMKAGKPE